MSAFSEARCRRVVKDSASISAEPYEALKSSTRRPYSRQQEANNQIENSNSSAQPLGKDGGVRLVRSAKVFRQVTT